MARAAIAVALVASSACVKPHRVEIPVQTIPTTTTSAPPTTVRVSRSYVVRVVPIPRATPSAEWASLVTELWGPAAPTAFRVIRCESGGRPDAVGPQTRYGRARGLFQVMNGPMEVVANIRTAFAMYQRRGWGPWVSSRGCWA